LSVGFLQVGYILFQVFGKGGVGHLASVDVKPLLYVLAVGSEVVVHHHGFVVAEYHQYGHYLCCLLCGDAFDSALQAGFVPLLS